MYNLGLEWKIYAWKQRRKSISKYDLMKALPELKKEADWIKEVSAQTLQAVMERLDRSFQNFFQTRCWISQVCQERFLYFFFDQTTHSH